MASTEKPIKLNPEIIKKVDLILRTARKDLGMIVLKSFLMSAGAVIPIVLISAMSGLLLTSFPMVAGFITAILIQVKYVSPKSKEVGDRYAKEIKDLIEEEKRRQAQES